MVEKTERVQWLRAIIWGLITLRAIPLFAETQNSTRTIDTTWVDTPPVIDGDLTDSVWQHAQVANKFFRAKEGDIQLAQLNMK